jgi:fructokinase
MHMAHGWGLKTTTGVEEIDGMALFGGIEAGGTKFVCAVGTGPGDIRAEIQFATTTPSESIKQATQFFKEQHALEPLQAIGIASFGPVDPDPKSSTFGYITTTPKQGWGNTNVAGPIRRALGIPIGFDSDVNGAALAEHRWGAAQGLDTFVYFTVGTGLGGGAMVNGRLLHGMMHPEMGHMLLPHDWDADPYAGACSYHADCWEGLASGPAIAERWHFPAEQLPAGHPSWHLEAHYLAMGLVNVICVLSPQRIILGGGVMKQAHLFPRIRSNVQTLLHGYIQTRQILEEIDEYIVPPALGGRAGVLGGIALAQDAVNVSPFRS